MSLKMYRGYIGQMQVASAYQCIVYGSVRGLQTEHTILRAAHFSAAQDRAAFLKRNDGSYSDVKVYRWDDEDGWIEDFSY